MKIKKLKPDKIISESIHADLAKRLRYDKKFGTFSWIDKPSPCISAGAEAGCTDSKGYRKIRFKGIGIACHRLVWFIETGYLPSIIDHINGNRSDNRIQNLRPCTTSENMMNSNISSRNTSGFKGVNQRKGRTLWDASIRIDGKLIILGSFKNKEDAILARKSGEEKYFGEFAASKGVRP